MPPDDPDPAPEHRTFQLTPERKLTTRYRVARAAIIIYFVTLLGASLTACSCPGFFVVMAVCAIAALVYGSRFQRILSVALLLFAVICFIAELRQVQKQNQRLRERVHAPNDLHPQRPQTP